MGRVQEAPCAEAFQDGESGPAILFGWKSLYSDCRDDGQKPEVDRQCVAENQTEDPADETGIRSNIIILEYRQMFRRKRVSA